MTTTHRNALLATLSPEQLPVAEQLLRGGMPAVRTAVAEQNKNAAAQGRPTVDATTIDRIAEDLLNRTNLALWKDRAAGAIGAGRELRLRDLRAVVTSAKTVSLDDESRAQLKELQASLTARLDICGRSGTRSSRRPSPLRTSRRRWASSPGPPDMSTRVSADMAARVVALISPRRWHAEQDAAHWREIVSSRPTRRSVATSSPTGIPSDDASRAVAVQNAGAIPELAKLLGMKVPPPPPPTRAAAAPGYSPRIVSSRAFSPSDS